MLSGLVPFSTARQSFSRTTAPVSAARSFNTAVPSINVANLRTNAFQKSHSPLRRPFYQQIALKNRNLNNKVNTAKVIKSCIVRFEGKDYYEPFEEEFNENFDDRMDGLLVVLNSPYFMVKSWLVQDQTVLALAILGQTTTGKESSNPFMAGSLPKTINSNNVDEESQKIGRQAQVMISDAEEYLISEDPVKQGRMEETENA
ncbi:hypothetical protein Tco_0014870 [Tanacetum coccineum]